MAKRGSKNQSDESVDQNPRKSRRQILLERKQNEELQQMRYFLYGVIGLIGLIAVAAFVFELFVAPNQAVAEVNGESITVREWQDQVRYQRAQLINGVETQYESFVGEDHESDEARVEAEAEALRFVQQFSQQQISLLTFASEQLGEFVLNQMVDDKLIRRGAEERGIAVTEGEVEEEIGRRFNYFGGESPTPFPTSTPAPEPTPSVTPIGAEAVAEEPAVEPAEELPASTPRPTATAVSEQSFNDQRTEELDGIVAAGADEDVTNTLYNQFAADSLYRQKLAEALFEESGESTEVPFASARLLIFNTREEADNAFAAIQGSNFLEVWNLSRSTAVEGVPSAATEIIWRTEDQYRQQYSQGIPDTIFSLAVGEVSEVVADVNSTTSFPVFAIIEVTGREDRELDEFTIGSLEQEALLAWLEEQRANSTIFENWRSRVPSAPTLNTYFSEPAPTPVPQVPVPVEGGE